jgi:hypothetical protein
VQPREIKPDHLISNLINNCDAIADIIHKRLIKWFVEYRNANDNIKVNYYFRDLWSNVTDASNMSMDNTTSSVIHTPKKQNYVSTKNINKPNFKGETPLHVACLKV